MSETQIVRDLFRAATLPQWPRLAWYFLGRAVHARFGVALFRQMMLKVGRISFIADVSGMSGLVFLHQIYCQRVYDFDSGVTEGTVFDVGANCGFFSLVQCAEHPPLRSVCFEPQPATCRKLRANVECNALGPRIEVVEAAVGATAGRCDLEISSHSSMGVVSSTGALLTDGHGRTLQTTRVSVPVQTLDDFSTGRGIWPTLIKVDVEGFEIPVLHGARECLRRAAAAIVECDSEDSCRDCGEILRDAGFEVSRRDSIFFGRRLAR